MSLMKAGPSAIAGIVAMQADVWMVIVFSSGPSERDLASTIEELRSLAETEHRLVETIDASPIHTFLRTISPMPADAIVFAVRIEELTDESLLEFDAVRTQLLGRTILFCTTELGLKRLALLCPNVYSWIGGQCFVFDGNEGVMNVEERLESLRRHFHLSDAEVIDRARLGTLPTDPAFVEWLALLGRGDLLGA